MLPSNFLDQDPRIDLVIQNMENYFETIGGKISTKFYKQRMRFSMNNFGHTCMKLFSEGKERDNSVTPK
jgi:hypothetical protein